MFKILLRDWNLKPIFTQKRASVDMNWGGVQHPTPRQFQPWIILWVSYTVHSFINLRRGWGDNCGSESSTNRPESSNRPSESGDWCLRLALRTPSGACHTRRRRMARCLYSTPCYGSVRWFSDAGIYQQPVDYIFGFVYYTVWIDKIIKSELLNKWQ